MYNTFTTPSRRCNNFARGAIRLGFHDAGAWRKGLDYGGADGGILLTEEIRRQENKGLEEIADQTKRWLVLLICIDDYLLTCQGMLNITDSVLAWQISFRWALLWQR